MNSEFVCKKEFKYYRIFDNNSISVVIDNGVQLIDYLYSFITYVVNE